MLALNDAAVKNDLPDDTFRLRCEQERFYERRIGALAAGSWRSPDTQFGLFPGVDKSMG
jgi:hypothetical protein